LITKGKGSRALSNWRFAMATKLEATHDEPGSETRELIRRFTDELENGDTNTALTKSLKVTVDLKEKELDKIQPWRDQYEPSIPV
jgi:hypothetical protein